MSTQQDILKDAARTYFRASCTGSAHEVSQIYTKMKIAVQQKIFHCWGILERRVLEKGMTGIGDFEKGVLPRNIFREEEEFVTTRNWLLSCERK